MWVRPRRSQSKRVLRHPEKGVVCRSLTAKQGDVPLSSGGPGLFVGIQHQLVGSDYLEKEFLDPSDEIFSNRSVGSKDNYGFFEPELLDVVANPLPELF